MDHLTGKLVVRGFWGPRGEAGGQCARRWLAFLERLPGLAPGRLVGWQSGDLRPVPVDVSLDGLSDFLVRETDQQDLDKGLGYRFYAWCEPAGGPRVRLSGSTGMTTSSAQLFDSVVVEIKAQRGSELAPEWPLIGVDVLAALAEEWEPDWGDVGVNELWRQMDEVRERPPRTPVAGFATYLSPGRVELAPPAVTKDGRRTREGGLVLSLVSKDGSLPGWEAVGEVDLALRASEAFGPVPTDRARLGDAPAGPAPEDAPHPSNGSAEGGLRLQRLRYEPTAANAVRFADDIAAAAARIDGRDLDYSLDSLRDVDDVLGGLHDDGVDVSQVGETIFGFGCYIGEVLVRAAGAEWVELDPAEQDMLGQGLAIRAPGGVLWNPVGKAFKRVENGPEDSIPTFATVVLSR